MFGQSLVDEHSKANDVKNRRYQKQHYDTSEVIPMQKSEMDSFRNCPALHLIRRTCH